MADLTIGIDLDRSQAVAQARQMRAEMAAMLAGILSDVQKNEAAKLAVQRDAQGNFVAGSKKATASIKDDFAQQSDAIGGAAKALGSFALQMVGLDSARAILGAIVDNFEMARKSAFDAGQMVTEYRENLLELAALKGKLGETTGAISEDIAFRAKTLQTAAASREFQLAALGVGESAIGTQITRQEWEKAMEKAGAFQAMESTAGAKEHGQLIGLIPSLNKEQITGEEAFQKEQQIYKIMQPGGFTFGSGIEQFSKLAPLIMSGTYKDTEAAALLSAFSTIAPGEAGLNVQQFTRGTIGKIGKRGRVTMEGGETLGQYFESLGINEDLVKTTETTKLPFEIGGRISADVQRAQSEAEARGEEFSELLYLQKKGYAAQEERNAISAYRGLLESGRLEETFMKRARPEALPTAEEAMAPIERAQATDPLLGARRAKLAEEASQVAVGAGEQEYLANLRRTAYARRRARGEEGAGSFEELQSMGALAPGNVLFGRRRQLDLEAQRMLWAEAERVGVAVPRRALRAPWASQEAADLSEGFQGDEALFELGRKVRAAGGNPLPGSEQVFAAAQAQLGEAGAFERGEPAAGGGGQGEVVGELKKLNKNLTPMQRPAPAVLLPPPVPARRKAP